MLLALSNSVANERFRKGVERESKRVSVPVVDWRIIGRNGNEAGLRSLYNFFPAGREVCSETYKIACKLRMLTLLIKDIDTNIIHPE